MAIEPHREPASLTRPSAAGSSRPAVLLVDDNAANLLALEALLSSLDVELVPAASGEEAMRQLLQRDFALVLMDIQMPGLDGFQTTALIRQRERSRHTPIIFLTAIFTDGDSAQRAYALDAVDYLTKPIDESILRAKVRALTMRHRALDVIERQAHALRIKQDEADREHAARQEAEAANRAKDEFLAMLSHELRAPLNAILGWSTELQSRRDLPADVGRGLDAIARGARAQSRLVDELLDVSQMVAGALGIAADVVDLGTTTQAALATMTAAATPKRIRFDLDVASEDHRVVGDAARLEQLLCALLSNAIKFSASESVVRVELSRTGAGIQVRVKDVGEGIRAELLPHVFERFRQGDASWTRRHGGLGIGLTLARHIAELHRGTIEAFSAGQGLGSVFVLTLPAYHGQATATRAATLAAAAEREPSLAARPLDGVRLLVVDDDGDARELLVTILERAGAVVVAAASAADALARFDAARFDVLVSDLGMPDEDGLSLMRKLRGRDAARGGTLKAIALSGYGTDEDRAESARAGFDAHLAKPIEWQTLMGTLTRLAPPR